MNDNISSCLHKFNMLIHYLINWPQNKWCTWLIILKGKLPTFGQHQNTAEYDKELLSVSYIEKYFWRRISSLCVQLQKQIK